MVLLLDAINALREFLDTGGQVLLVIGFVTFAMWLLILERFMFVFGKYRGYKNEVLQAWNSRNERNSWNAEQIRQATISRVGIKLNANLPYINVMVHCVRY